MMQHEKKMRGAVNQIFWLTLRYHIESSMFKRQNMIKYMQC